MNVIRKKTNKLVEKARNKSMPGFSHIPIYDVVSFFWQGIVKGSISTRAAAVAFYFFMSIFPALIFLFTLIPYFPIQNYQDQMLEMMQGFLPHSIYSSVEGIVIDLLTKEREGLLSLGFLGALFFATNAVSAMIEAFNSSHHITENRSFIKLRVVSVMLVFLMSLIMTVAIVLIIFFNVIVAFLMRFDFMDTNFVYYLLLVGRWFIILLLFYYAISTLYWYAPARRMKWRFNSIGALVATIFITLASWIFSLYINNFGQYNELYGSIGTLIALLFWLQIVAFILIIGFELNTSLRQAKHERLESGDTSILTKKELKKKEKLELKDQPK